MLRIYYVFLNVIFLLCITSVSKMTRIKERDKKEIILLKKKDKEKKYSKTKKEFLKKTNEEVKKKDKKLTIVIDFDDTITSNTKDEDVYIYILYDKIIEDNNYSKIGFKYFLIQEYLKIEDESVMSYHKIIQNLHKKYKIKIQKKYFDYTIDKLKENQQSKLKKIIQQLSKREDILIIIIGGGSWGCAILPSFLEDMNISKKQIYSGYFKDFSEKEIDKSLEGKFRYVNCEYLEEIDTPYTDKKSELIKYLEEKKIISNNIIAIGDHVNDLEIFEAGEADFIGFGINKNIKIVKEKVSYYKKNGLEKLNDLSEIIIDKIDEKIKSSKKDIIERNIEFVESMEEFIETLENFIEKRKSKK